MNPDLPQAPDGFDPQSDDAALDAQFIGALFTLALVVIFCLGVAFGFYISGSA